MQEIFVRTKTGDILSPLEASSLPWVPWPLFSWSVHVSLLAWNTDLHRGFPYLKYFEIVYVMRNDGHIYCVSWIYSLIFFLCHFYLVIFCHTFIFFHLDSFFIILFSDKVSRCYRIQIYIQQVSFIHFLC